MQIHKVVKKFLEHWEKITNHLRHISVFNFKRGFGNYNNFFFFTNCSLKFRFTQIQTQTRFYETTKRYKEQKV